MVINVQFECQLSVLTWKAIRSGWKRRLFIDLRRVLEATRRETIFVNQLRTEHDETSSMKR